MTGEHEPLDEIVLRRALRLESDERMPRLGAGAIALMAQRPRVTQRAIVAAALGASAMAVVAVALWSAIFALAPALADGIMSTLIDLAIGVATLVLPIAEIASQPAVPVSLLAALSVAILHELRERREHAHANAS
ncbi:MAG TPA: hypothetical protein VM052_01805 [Candidatus Limnocylindrales bacterium]|nr:hypothetical protein [Candidatus Limnocylindrales bacterium]